MSDLIYTQWCCDLCFDLEYKVHWDLQSKSIQIKFDLPVIDIET